MKIETVEQLKVHLKVLKMKFKKNGYSDLQLYPAFCVYYGEHQDKYHLSKEVVLNHACDILIAGE